MLRLLLGKDWTANTREIMRRIGDDIRACKTGRILLVPELISHETERAICEVGGDTASRYSEVLSFTRLANRVAESVGDAARECMDNGGRVVAMAAAARQINSKLKAYASVETKPEFLTGLLDGIDEFKRCCITPADLSKVSEATEGSLAQKLEELALLMQGYDALCENGKRDPRDQMNWLLEQLEISDFAEKHVFYMDGFPDLTRQHLAILEYLIQVSPEVTVSLNCDTIDSRMLSFEKASKTAGEIYRCAHQAGIEVSVEYVEPIKRPLESLREKLFQGRIAETDISQKISAVAVTSKWEECMSAAHRTAELVIGGCRYRDVSIVCTDIAAYRNLISLVFDRMHIPVYFSGTEDILQKSIISTVLTALDAALSGFETRNVYRYLRSALAPLDQNTCDLIENYTSIWGIRGIRWCEEWKMNPRGLVSEEKDEDGQKLAMLNSARILAIDPLVRLRDAFRRANNVREQVVALYQFMHDIELNVRLDTLAGEMDSAGQNRESQILDQLWEILIGALEQMHDVLGSTYWEDEHFVRLLRLLLSQYDVGTIPPVLDAVQVGTFSSMRCHSQKHLIILGAEEGKLPSYSGSMGVLTDSERVALRDLGLPLTGGAMEGIQAEFSEIYGVFCGAQESVEIYCPSEQPSFVFKRVAEMAGGVKSVVSSLDFAIADAEEAGAWLSQKNAADVAYRLGVDDIYRSICSKRDYDFGAIRSKTIQSLYGAKLNLSASQIDKHADCRLAYFLNYGLRVREQKEATVDPAEFGTYVHEVLEKTCQEVVNRGGFQAVQLDEILEIAHRYSDEYFKARFSDLGSERMKYLFDRNIRELDMVACELWEELRESSFEPRGFEVGFGDEEALPAIQIPNDNMPAQIRGFVDRVDVWKRPDNNYYRVVDYKTGQKDFDYCDVLNGVGLQMLLYMFALRDSGYGELGKTPIAAGVQYFPARVPFLSVADGSDETAEKERKKTWKRKGLILSDEEVIQAMEPGKPNRLSYSVKEGAISGDVADREQFKLLEEYVFRVLSNQVDDIASGNITPNPYTRGQNHNACSFCPYGAVCREKREDGRRNYKQVSAKEFWEQISEEVPENG